jgi:hypothetical protein
MGYERPAIHTLFHLHLDDCKRCREHPFDLCSVGKDILSLMSRQDPYPKRVQLKSNNRRKVR